MGDALRKYIGNFSSESLADVFAGKAPARRPREAQLPEDISEINGLLNIQPREPKTPRGTASIKIFGQETRFVVINPQTVSRFLIELMTQSQTVVPQLFGQGLKVDNRRALLLINTRVEFPSVLGFPIGSSIRLPVFGGVKGNLKVQMQPAPQAGAGFFKQIPQKVHFYFNRKMLYNYNSIELRLIQNYLHFLFLQKFNTNQKNIYFCFCMVKPNRKFQECFFRKLTRLISFFFKLLSRIYIAACGEKMDEKERSFHCLIFLFSYLLKLSHFFNFGYLHFCSSKFAFDS